MAGGGRQVRILSFNIKQGLFTSLEAVAGTLVSVSPDIALLQEVGRNWAWSARRDQPAELSALCGMQHFSFAAALEQSGGEYGLLLLSRWPLEELEPVPLPAPNDEPRVLQVTRIAPPGPPLTVLHTHLSVDPGDRLEQARIIASQLHLHPSPRILAGDFNDEPGSETLGEVTALLAEARVRAEDGLPSPTFPSHAPNRLLDHVLVETSMRVGFYAVLQQKTSDHLPLLVELEI